MAKKKRRRREADIALQADPDIRADLDPHLQGVLLRSRSNKSQDRAIVRIGAAGGQVVDVIAKLRDVTRNVPGLNIARCVGQVVTGTVAVGEVEAVRSDRNVISLKRATRLQRHLEHSVPEIRATQEDLRDSFPDLATLDGSGVIVGIVDEGCDFVHHNFRNPDGTTRLVCLWDQRPSSTPSPPTGYEHGRELRRDAINAALRRAQPTGPDDTEHPAQAYEALDYKPKRAAHGTHVMDIAAGNGRATDVRGVAPSADIVFVHIATDDVPDDDSLGNSRQLLEAVEYIFAKATELQRPAVVNLSLGTYGGPHDGSTLAEQWFDGLLDKPGRAIVLSAGNSRDSDSHAAGRLDPAQMRVLQWQISAGDVTENELEIWYESTAELTVTLVTPGGVRLGPVPLGAAPRKIVAFGALHGSIIHRRNDPNNHDHQIDILLDAALPSGIWSVELQNVGSSTAMFHAWIERDDVGQSRFVSGADQSHTLGSISCGKRTIVVGSYDSQSPSHELSSFSAEGTSRDGKQKPELSAPGGTRQRPIMAAESLTQGTTGMAGTSMAAPHVAGVVALMMQASASRGLDVAQIRDALLGSARPTVPDNPAWHSRYGMGRVDTVAAVRNILR